MPVEKQQGGGGGGADPAERLSWVPVGEESGPGGPGHSGRPEDDKQCSGGDAGIPAEDRMLRYYEERGLLTPERAPSGYRHYRETDVERATLVSSLIRSGLPTKLIIPLLRDDQPGPTAGVESTAGDDGLTALFAAELARLESRIACMSLSRDTVRRHLRHLGTEQVTGPSETA